MTRAATFFGIAAVAGTVHGGFSVYWGAGGTALLDTLGAIADRVPIRWLILVGALKIAAALLPLVLLRESLREGVRRPLRWICWVGSLVLIVWGGTNTVSASLLLLDAIPRPDDFDRTGTIGHALLWDPLFLVWGAALLIALRASRPGALTLTPSRARPTR